MPKVITVPVTSFTSHEKLAQALNEVVTDKNVRGVFFNKSSLTKGEFEILVDESVQKVILLERPSKFKQNASSQYYCVYKKGNGWTYKFVNKKISDKPFLGKLYETENAAAHAYDEHRYSVEGDLSKLNFPENFIKKG